MNLEPINQKKLYNLTVYFNELANLYKKKKLPSKILLSGQKGIGKSTLAYHLINFVLSQDEENKYDLNNQSINKNNKSYKLTINKSNPNFILIDILEEKKTIDILQIRNLISNLNKSSFNTKPRFILIDNIEYLNINSVNALLKVLEEPAMNTFFILIHNNKKILSTLSSRCLNYKISLSNKSSLDVIKNLLGDDIFKSINEDLINYYSTPGNFFYLIKFVNENNLDLSKIDLKNFLLLLIKENYYKKNISIKYMIYDYIEFYFRKNSLLFNKKLSNNYSYFLKKVFDTKKFNLDEESLFMEFEEEILNG
jgi:DNA polymerase-3 subunit delta'